MGGSSSGEAAALGDVIVGKRDLGESSSRGKRVVWIGGVKRRDRGVG